MKIKVLLILISVLFLVGCYSHKVPDTDESLDINNTIEDINYASISDANQFLNSEQLKERLLMAYAIELKNIDNQTIGIIKETEKIVSFVEGIFKYRIQKELNNSPQYEVVGPINFYFSDSEDIYGLMNDQYIYIEGYYFLINPSISKELQSIFKANIATAPTGTE